MYINPLLRVNCELNLHVSQRPPAKVLRKPNELLRCAPLIVLQTNRKCFLPAEFSPDLLLISSVLDVQHIVHNFCTNTV